MTDTQGVTSYEYDNLNRLTKITYPQTLNGQPAVIEYGYDAVGNRTLMITPKGTTNYIYDDAGRLASITHPNFSTVSYEYDKVGNRTKMTYPNGVYTTYEYDPNNYRLFSIKHFNKIGVMYDHYDYMHDNVGNRMGMTTNIGFTSYEYDNLYQLTGVDTPKRGRQEYSYDPAGNRTHYSDRNGEISYTYNNANELLESVTQGFSPASYSYDGNGNLVTKNDFTYSWDFKNQLIEVKKSGGTIAQFKYDGDGRRMRSTYNAGPTTINYIWDGMSEILETDGSGNVVTEYLNGAGEILGKIRYLPSGIRQVWYYLHDGLGSTTYLLDNYGNIVNAYYYEPYGKCWNVTHDPGHNTRFTGKEYEEDFGLYYFYARWYDAEAGRFVGRDPKRDWPNYIYCLDNPIICVDPYGMDVYIYREGIHIGFAVDNPKEKDKIIYYDFYSGASENVFNVFLGGPGRIFSGNIEKNRLTSEKQNVFVIKTEPWQDQNIYYMAEESTKNPPRYGLLSYNCTSFTPIYCTSLN